MNLNKYIQKKKETNKQACRESAIHTHPVIHATEAGVRLDDIAAQQQVILSSHTFCIHVYGVWWKCWRNNEQKYTVHCPRYIWRKMNVLLKNVFPHT